MLPLMAVVLATATTEEAMHGQIGERDHRVAARRDLDFYYHTRAALLDSYRRTGDGTIDYDFYRTRARVEQNRARHEALRRLTRFVRPLLAVAAIATAIWMMPTQAQDCASCGTQAVVTTATAAK
jgi:hypothetical protein